MKGQNCSICNAIGIWCTLVGGWGSGLVGPGKTPKAKNHSKGRSKLAGMIVHEKLVLGVLNGGGLLYRFDLLEFGYGWVLWVRGGDFCRVHAQARQRTEWRDMIWSFCQRVKLVV